MASLWRTLMLLLLVPGCGTQSGDADAESRLSCTSHIATDGNSLTCQLLGRRGDDEDDEEDDIVTMSLCSVDWTATPSRSRCVKRSGNRLDFLETPVVDFNLSVHTRRGRTILAMVDLKKIVKPKRPWVWNVTFNQETNQLVLHIRSPYGHDYLRDDNQLFQLHIWSSAHHTTQNVSSENTLTMDMRHLRSHAPYQVTVRAIPVMPLQGSWSEWSDPFGFVTPDPGEERRQPALPPARGTLKLWLLLLMVASLAAALCWKLKIVSYLWPSIPHPKDSVHSCRSTGLLLNFKVEVFSDLSVSSGATPPRSIRSSRCSAEEEELRGPEGEGPPEEAYVTMSSFPHVKSDR